MNKTLLNGKLLKWNGSNAWGEVALTSTKAGELLQQNESAIKTFSNTINSLVIVNEEKHIEAASILTRIKTAYKKLDVFRKDAVKPINEEKQRIQDFFKPLLEKYVSMEKTVKNRIQTYENKEQQRICEEQERLRLMAKAKERKEKEALAKRIQDAEIKGDSEEIMILEQQKEDVHIVVPEILAPIKPKGLSSRSSWDVEIIEQNEIPREYMIPNLAMLKKVAQATKGNLKIKGVKFIENTSIVSR